MKCFEVKVLVLLLTFANNLRNAQIPANAAQGGHFVKVEIKFTLKATFLVYPSYFFLSDSKNVYLVEDLFLAGFKPYSSKHLHGQAYKGNEVFYHKFY